MLARGYGGVGCDEWSSESPIAAVCCVAYLSGRLESGLQVQWSVRACDGHLEVELTHADYRPVHSDVKHQFRKSITHSSTFSLCCADDIPVLKHSC